MRPLDLSNVLEDFEGKWVALSTDERDPKVFGSGETAKEAIRDAVKKGNNNYCLMYVRPFDLLFSGFSQVR